MSNNTITAGRDAGADLARFVPGLNVTVGGREGQIFTAPVVSQATGNVCFGVRFDDGSASIVKAYEVEADDHETCGYCGGQTTNSSKCDACGIEP